jgi:hypothetical protein
MSLKLKEKMNHLPLLDALIDDDDFSLNTKLDFFAKNIKNEVIKVIDSFLSFFIKYSERKTYDMLAFMLDPRFKILILITSFIRCEHEATIDEKYDRKSLFVMLLKSYHHLHPLFKVESSYVHKIYEDISLNIFEMVASTSELTKFI